MSFITAILYGVLAVYLGGWFLSFWQGNFSLLLFVLSAVTMLYWLAERYKFRPAREASARQLLEQDQARRAQLQSKGIAQIDGNVEEARSRLLMQPWWLDWTAGLFPVIVVVFLMRSFLFEPFKIPSGSMVPTLRVGDLILVNKYHYGVRLPVIHKKIISNNEVQRGDVVVFRYPENPSQDYIKRIVAVAGDEVAYINKRLTVNGQELAQTPMPDFYDGEIMRYVTQYAEKIGDQEHHVLVDGMRPPYIPEQHITNYPYRENCRYSGEGVRCTVPAGHYYAMGDNRDYSLDSRYWGFVPDENIVGKAFVVWMNFGDLKRIGFFH